MSDISSTQKSPHQVRFAALPDFQHASLGTWLTNLLQSSERGVLVVASDRRIVMVNDTAGQMFGYRDGELLGLAIAVLLPTRTRSSYMAQLASFAAMRVTGRRLRIKLDLKGRRATGDEFYVGTSLSRLAIKGEMFLALIIQELKPGQCHPSPTFMLRRFAGSSQQANESDRRHFSRALYDDIGQRLSVLKLDLDWYEAQPGDLQTSTRLRRMQRMLSDIISSTRTIATALRPPLLDDLGLHAAIEWISKQFSKRTGIVCHLECRADNINVNDVVDSTVFRIVEEALDNIERHAQARNVGIALWRTDHALHIDIADDGIGLHDSWRTKPGCLGLMAMDERIAILGGSIRITSLHPSGVAIHVSLPADALTPPIAKP